MSIIGSAVSTLLGKSGDTWIWSEHLHPASFRGVPFAVQSGESVFGRRQAVHEYPFRDTVWVEDLGRSTRRITIRGFIVQSSQLYLSHDVITQRDSLVAACEEKGPGTLVHPTLGEIEVSIPDNGLRITEGEAGRVFEFTLTFIESGLRVFAITDASTAVSTVRKSWFALVSQVVATFIAVVKSEIRAVNQLIKTLKNTANFWVRMVDNTINEATNLGNTFRSTFGSSKYERYNYGKVGGSTVSGTGKIQPEPDTEDLPALISQRIAISTESREAVNIAGENFISSDSIDDYGNAAGELINSMLSDAVGPADQIRIMEDLASQSNSDVFYNNPADEVVSSAADHMMNVLAAGAMAYAASQYQPTGYDDANELLTRVCDAIDRVALSSADRGNDAEYALLIEMRQSIVAILQQAGANLAKMEQVNFNRSLPSLTIANRLYQDTSRSDGLVKMVNPVHPAFMPPAFKALSS
ncbi:DNA circularization protein [Budviciaceae bacterium BWR-B9]|uniref:DNA circularization protein n=1 Tax=Limnobaculum allomyrinae TaxID=2791986 RepID=A0ABS1IW48_9GAMM|nr:MULTISPECIES: DNA circularization N-terminal domain-containing protein [Limnobaculum]MBK5146002.1 DNA circularization protein [Limnobaculum allomyrinae]MBV7694027.1 DNA circularization N-terminal domain-containing protein [Limnobaculum sp. M2-1]